MSLTPKSDAAEPLWKEFHSNVQRRLESGKRAYGDSSFDRPLERLIVEIQEELEDVSGWAAILWSRLEAIRAKVAGLNQ